jgi:hypothetical protein
MLRFARVLKLPFISISFPIIGLPQLGRVLSLLLNRELRAVCIDMRKRVRETCKHSLLIPYIPPL